MLGVFKEQLRELCGWNRVNKDGEGGMADSTEALLWSRYWGDSREETEVHVAPSGAHGVVEGQ